MMTQVNFDSIGGGGTRVAEGNITVPVGNITTSLPFKARKLYLYKITATAAGSWNNNDMAFFYDADYNANIQYGMYRSSSNYLQIKAFPGSSTNFTGIVDITDTGFTVRANSSGYDGNYHYVAIE